MLVTFDEILPNAYRQGYAVGCFLAYNLETAKAIIETAVEERSPVIVAVSEKGIKYSGLENISGLILEMAERAPIPVVLHLDHGRDLNIIQKCLANNFSSVMIDASEFPENDKIVVTKKVVKWADKYGVTVESERDSLIGSEDGVAGKSDDYTQPDAAAVFVKETGIDVFAPSIGNAHGKPIPGETLDLDLLEKVNKKLRMPLSLHGASGTPPQEIRGAIKCGVTKINIDTDLRIAFIATLSNEFRMNHEISDPREVLQKGMDAMKLVVRTKIRLFGSSGRA